MTKLVPLTFLCLLLACSIVCAQTSPAGSVYVSTGIGIVPAYTGKTVQTNVPAINFELSYRVTNNFSMSAYAAYTKATSTPQSFSDGAETHIENQTKMLGLKGQLHKNFTDKFEMYGGAVIGYASFNKEETYLETGQKVIRDKEAPTPFDPNAPDGQITYAGFIGAKYWATPKFGLYSELGFGLSIMNAGFSFKF